MPYYSLDTSATTAGVSAVLRPHNILFPLSGALISLILPNDRRLPAAAAAGVGGQTGAEAAGDAGDTSEAAEIVAGEGSGRVIQAIVSSVRVCGGVLAGLGFEWLSAATAPSLPPSLSPHVSSVFPPHPPACGRGALGYPVLSLCVHQPTRHPSTSR